LCQLILTLMSVTTDLTPARSRSVPEPRAVLTLLKPITWFPPMWAYLCGAVSAGVAPGGNWLVLILGVILAGPIVCGMSQAANDWCDRHVDAINEPDRPIPSGRIPGRWGLWIALSCRCSRGFHRPGARPLGLRRDAGRVAAAWAYSAEPVRLKKSGWWGPGLVGLSYEPCRGSPAPPCCAAARRPGRSSSSRCSTASARTAS
jgi:chlorophyll synthase